MNDLDMTLCIDTNFLGNETRAAGYLRRMSAAGCISLVASSVLWREIEPSSKVWLSEEALVYPVNIETAVVGESRFGDAVFGSESDADLLAELKSIVAPGGGTGTLRDIMHLHTAIRCGADALVTTDEDDILRKKDALAHLIAVWMPETAATAVMKQRVARRVRARIG